MYDALCMGWLMSLNMLLQKVTISLGTILINIECVETLVRVWSDMLRGGIDTP
jgi:hypothetical protein